MKSQTLFKIAGFIIILILALLLRVWGLERDAPSIDLYPDEAAWTDEGVLATPAINAALDVTSNAMPLPIQAHPLYELALTQTFRWLGVGRLQGRLFSAAIGLCGLILLAILGRSIWKEAGALIALALGTTSFFNLVLDRSILLEGSLVAVLALVAILGLRARSTSSAFVTGVALAFAVVGIKLHALALAPALIVLFALRRRNALMPFLLGMVTVFILWRTFWVMDLPNYDGYLETRLTEPYMGLANPLEFFVHLIFAGLGGYFFPYQIALLLFALIEILALVLAPRRWFQNASDEIIVALVWLVSALAGASLFRYMPARYFAPALFPFFLLAIAGIRRVWQGVPMPPISPRARLGIGLGFGIFLLFQIAPPLPLFGDAARWIPILGLPAPLFFIWLMTRTSQGWGLNARARTILVGGLLVFHFAFQIFLFIVGIATSQPDLASAAMTLKIDNPKPILVGRLAESMKLFAPIDASSVYGAITESSLEPMARIQPVWVIVLSEDEKLIEPVARAHLARPRVFPINYSSKSQSFTIYEFDPTLVTP